MSISKDIIKTGSVSSLPTTKKAQSLVSMSYPYRNGYLNMNNMKQDNYIPQPIDTSDVQLPEELTPLFETMAKNVHEIWAQTRIAQGWQYGSEHNDAEKLHPMLIPYEYLQVEEKVLERGQYLIYLRSKDL